MKSATAWADMLMLEKLIVEFDWIELAQDKVHWQGFVNTVMSLIFHKVKC
jgi:hypothetical protein